MTTEKIKDLKIVKLSDYFTPEKFRTVPVGAEDVTGGITEVRAVFNLHDNFARLLTFQYSSTQVIYGYARLNEKLRAINKHTYISSKGKGLLKQVTFNDCGDLFILVFELTNEKEELVTVKADEVAYLLNNCRHPNGEPA